MIDVITPALQELNPLVKVVGIKEEITNSKIKINEMININEISCICLWRNYSIIVYIFIIY